MKNDIAKLLKDGTPVKVVSEAEVKSQDGVIRMILTKEVTDRDGDIVSVDGMDVSNFMKNPVLLDSHKMNHSVLESLLGNVKNLTKTTDQNGVKMIVGEIDFAPSPQGQIAKALVEGGYAKTVSIGFGVMDYNAAMNMITKSELYEVSLVNVPANVEAQIIKSLKDGEKMEDKLMKTLKNYDDIKPKIKQYRALFMSDDLCKALGIEKTGDELVDLKNVYDAVIKELEEKNEEVEEPKKENDQVNPGDKNSENQTGEDPEPGKKEDQDPGKNEDPAKKEEDVIEPTKEELTDMVGGLIRQTFLNS